MVKLFVIAGHGAGDPGACAGGQNEAALVRKLASRIKDLGGAEVQIGDMSRNWYAEKLFNSFNFGGAMVIELHMDSAVPSARGGHVIINSAFSADAFDKALADFIGGFMPGRSKTLVGRSDLANCNISAKRGINYRLMECGFISNDGDRSKFINQMDELARGILAAAGIGAGTGTAPAPSNPNTGTTAPQTGYMVKVTADALNIRGGAGTNHGVTGCIRDKGTYTIVAEADGPGAKKWGKLKSGTGWIALDFTQRVTGGSAPAAPRPATIKVGSTVRVTNPVDVSGTHLAVSGTYTVMEVKGSRVVIGRGGVVTAAINIGNLALA